MCSTAPPCWGCCWPPAARTTVSSGPRGLLIATGYRWRLPFAGAFTVGNVVLFRAGPAEALANPVLLGHEERHSTQYAWCLGLPFLPLYFLAAGWSLWRTGNPGTGNFFERHAGLQAGGYPAGQAARTAATGRHGRRQSDRAARPLSGTRHDMTDSPRTIAVTGSGSAEAAPDLLTLSIGVECRREDVGTAYGDAGRVSAAITAVLREHGVGSAGHHHLGPERPCRGQLAGGPGPDGLRATWRPACSLCGSANWPRSSEIIAAAVAAGGNDVRLNGLELGFADPVGRHGPGPGGRVAGRPARRRSTSPPFPARSSARSSPSPSSPASRRPSPWRRWSVPSRRTRSRSKPASPVSARRSASSGN